MPEPGLVLWIIGAPFILGVIDLFGTRSAMKRKNSAVAGRPWSQATRIDQPHVGRVIAAT